jgi:hypothetical protein
MAQNSRSTQNSQAIQSSWTRERKIYLAVGVLASLVGVLLIAFSL